MKPNKRKMLLKMLRKQKKNETKKLTNQAKVDRLLQQARKLGANI